MSEKKEITVVEHIEANPKNENFGRYRLSNGVEVYFSNYHPFKTDQEAKEFVDLIINAQKMRDMLEKAERTLREVYDCDTAQIKELLTN
jgi:hypothetical protein